MSIACNPSLRRCYSVRRAAQIKRPTSTAVGRNASQTTANPRKCGQGRSRSTCKWRELAELDATVGTTENRGIPFELGSRRSERPVGTLRARGTPTSDIGRAKVRARTFRAHQPRAAAASGLAALDRYLRFAGVLVRWRVLRRAGAARRFLICKQEVPGSIPVGSTHTRAGRGDVLSSTFSQRLRRRSSTRSACAAAGHWWRRFSSSITPRRVRTAGSRDSCLATVLPPKRPLASRSAPAAGPRLGTTRAARPS